MADRSLSTASLRTARLELRDPTRMDVGGFLKLYSDPTTARYIREAGAVDEATIAEEIDEYAVDFERGWSKHWSCIERSSGAFVGFVALHEFRSPTPILSYAIMPEYRRRGFATEAIGAVLEFAATLNGANSVVAHVHLDNAASAELLTKIGFVDAGQVELPRGVRREFRRALK